MPAHRSVGARRPGRWGRGPWTLAALALAACHGGHYPARPHPEELATGSPLYSETLDERDAWLRHYLMTAEAPAALALLEDERSAPEDALIRGLQRGIALRAAGRMGESNAAFDSAEWEVDRRYARSVSQRVGTLLVNDGTVSYLPPPAEAAMIPFYRMLNYLHAGNADEARVEARKAVEYLQRLRGAAGEPCVGEGMVQYLAGLTFAAAGDRGDALVALRQAERAYDACGAEGAGPPPTLGEDLYHAARAAGVGEVADSAAARYGYAPDRPASAGYLVLVLEQGWVAHRAGDAIHVPIWGSDVDGLDRHDDDGIAASAGRVSARLLEAGLERAQWGSTVGDHPLVQVAAALEGAYVMRLAWPVFHLESPAPFSVQLRVDSAATGAPPSTDLSALLMSRWERQRPAALARMVGRGMTKYLISREAERTGNRAGEAVGWVVGRATNFLANRMERADTRSWSLLPDRIALLRLMLPPGEHRLQLEIVDYEDATPRLLELGPVQVRAGRVQVMTTHIWSDEAEL